MVGDAMFSNSCPAFVEYVQASRNFYYSRPNSELQAYVNQTPAPSAQCARRTPAAHAPAWPYAPVWPCPRRRAAECLALRGDTRARPGLLCVAPAAPGPRGFGPPNQGVTPVTRRRPLCSPRRCCADATDFISRVRASASHAQNRFSAGRPSCAAPLTVRARAELQLQPVLHSDGHRPARV